MKDILTYFAIVGLAILLVACPSPENNGENGNSGEVPVSPVDTIDIPCALGQIIQITCDSLDGGGVVYLPCNPGSKVACGDKIYFAIPVDTIDTPSEAPVDTIDFPSEAPVDTIDTPEN